ncbi:unnamed protein product, partial [Musa acuminata subsp. burmannicoides]
MVLYSCEEPKEEEEEEEEEEERGVCSRQFDVPCPGFRGRWSLSSHEVGCVSYEPKLPVVCNACPQRREGRSVEWVGCAKRGERME